MLRYLAASFFLVSFFCPAPVQSAEEQGDVSLITVQGQLLGLDDRPVAGRPVHVLGISRGAAGYNTQEFGNYDRPSWNSKTDKDGRFIFCFFNRPHDFSDPSIGTYAIIADGSARDAGAVSTRFIWNPGEPFTEDDVRPSTEWPPPVPLQDSVLRLTLHLQQGFTLEGRIWDYVHPDKPFPGLEFHVYDDLYAETHTGAGAEIFLRSATADQKGRFKLKHCFPVKIYGYPELPPAQLKAGARTPAWLQTKEKGKWIDGSPILSGGNGTVVDLEIRVNVTSTFHFFGKVTDATGRPLAGVDVNGECKTDATGSYSFYIQFPSLKYISFTLSGFANQSVYDEKGVSCGEHDVVLQPQK